MREIERREKRRGREVSGDEVLLSFCRSDTGPQHCILVICFAVF